ncbi:MAG: hypothetical protein Q8R72_02335 [Hylemonella sp.]|nr:hypothetical protein [Hylemonella sp.]
MFSFLKRPSSKPSEAPDSTPPETNPARMSLSERMAYRREMLYQSIRESLLQLEVIPSMYKFRVMNVDPRHHRFVAMVEVTNSFEPKMSGMSVGFNQVEAFIKKRTQERADLSLDGIFWRVNEVESTFVHSRRAGDGPLDPRSEKAVPRREVPADASAARHRLSRGDTQPGLLGAISVEHLDYESDMVPLQASDKTGGTQYGQL